jgi:hypothetical protein
MTKKHTQGKWQIHKPDYEHINIVTDKNFICEIPSCIAINEDTEERQSEAEANAKLIAAAPQMLEALIKINGLIADCTDGKINVGQIAKISIEAINAATNQ